MTAGPLAGTAFPLDPDQETRIGRGLDCQIALHDPLCSREHCVLRYGGGMWQIHDSESRNGTFVNGQRIDEASLDDGHVVRVGSTEFSFHVGGSSDSRNSSTAEQHGLEVTQTIVQDAPIHDRAPLSAEVLPDKDQVRELILLHQLSIKLLGCEDPAEVIRIGLDLLHDRTQAAIVGFLWLDDQGRLKPKLVLPAEKTGDVKLSASLTELVSLKGRAVWVANQSPAGSASESWEHFADALCAPLVQQGKMLGAIHVYHDKGRFRQSDFDFTISLANILSVSLARAREHSSMATDLNRLKESSPGFDELIGESKPMMDLKSKIKRVAAASGCVLIRGESGAGKELVARAIHRASPRADRPMLSVNCAAIPTDLMESQLFGHKAGAFTSADRDHVGYFQQADLGTLFLDEVGELVLEGQSKLLRILEGHPFLPVGATEEVSVDVRVIAATNQNLQTYVREKKFREDLFYRLSVFELYVPPLREREGDIELLINFFLDGFRRQHGRPNLKLDDAARSKLISYRWPGNVRQLRNVMDSAVVLAEGNAIKVSDLGLHDAGTGEELDSLKIEDWERKLIAEALKRTTGNVPDAAKLLGIGRATLYRKIEQYEIAR